LVNEVRGEMGWYVWVAVAKTAIIAGLRWSPNEKRVTVRQGASIRVSRPPPYKVGVSSPAPGDADW
jgi:hypothetical protein